MKSIFGLFITFCSAVILTSCGENAYERNTAADELASTNTAEKKQETTAGKREANFIDDVMEANNEETAWLHAAVDNGTDAGLKAFAQQMIPEHEQMNSQLKEYASKHNIELDDDDTTVIILDINEDKGKDWDKEWTDEMADRHRKIVRKFERAQDRIKDAELKSIVDNALPKLRTHLETIGKLEDRISKNGDK
jgi:putative membrane protein